MAVTIDRDEIAALCQRHRVTRLTLFGSAATDDFDPRHSDIDFLAEFTSEARLDDYFALKADLEELFGRPVDLVARRSLENPFFAAAVRETAEDVYLA
ncbi:nucleotidyltransferase family protein [Mumia quercus]|uniref:nucleotidyltransferase family protein n=1 Tax=Mumia quercus TaxID=2976125 RepID=UPI0021D138B0|nr:nucleotidyltransferase domain-containing protein [Mumia quercus]